MIIRIAFNFIVVVLIKFSLAGRLVPLTETGSLNFTTKELGPNTDLVAAEAFIEEGKITPLQPLERLVANIPIDELQDDSHTEASAQNTKTVDNNSDGNLDKITQVQKQYKGKKGHKSAKFGEKKGHKKGHKTKGYNNRFHKDEYHKEHKLYGDGYRDNHNNRYTDSHHAHMKNTGGFGKNNKHSHSHSDNRFGKKGVDDVGSFDDSHKNFEKDSKHEQLNQHQIKKIHIKDERNPYPNHRPY